MAEGGGMSVIRSQTSVGQARSGDQRDADIQGLRREKTTDASVRTKTVTMPTAAKHR